MSLLMRYCKSCAVSGCINSQFVGNGLPFHEFPKNKEISRQWIDKCNNDNINIEYNRYFVCSEHFTEDDYEPNSKVKLLPTAVPSLKLGKEHSVATENTIDNPTSGTSSNLQSDTCQTLKTVYAEAALNQELLKKDFKQYKKLNEENDKVIQDLQKQICSLETGLQSYHNDLNNFDRAITYFFRESIGTIFDGTPTSNYDKMTASLRIRYISENCYNYLTSDIKFPLTNLCDMKNWLRNVDYTQGVLHKYLTVMNILTDQRTLPEKYCVLQFGYIKTKPLYEYMSEVDVIIGPWEELCFVLVTGLMSDWKQLIYSSFDKKITKDILLDLIMRLHNDSYIVKACVSDYYEDMYSLWNDFDFNLHEPYFLHPTTEEKVFFFIGSTGIIVKLSDLLVNQGFHLSDGSEINVNPIKNLLMQTNSNSKHNLTSALQLFSHDTILLLQQLGPEYSKVAYPTELFIRNVMNWYKIASSVYGTENKEDENLTEILQMVLQISMDGNAHIDVMNDALMLSIASLKLFQIEMWQEQIITGEMHTKSLSNWELNALFKEIRETGYSYKHVTPLLVFTQLKKKMSRAVCSTEDDNCYLIQKFLSVFEPEPQDRDTPEIPELLLCHSEIISTVPESDVVNYYVVGWVADKLLDTHRELGTRATMFFKSSEGDLVNITYNITPSKDWWMNAHILYSVFESMYESSLEVKRNSVIEDLLKPIKMSCPYINLEVARSFFKEHLMLYLEYMNRDLDSTANDMDQS